MVKILHEDIPAFSGQGIHGTIDFSPRIPYSPDKPNGWGVRGRFATLVSTISFLVHLIKGLLADVYLLNNSGNNYVPSELK